MHDVIANMLERGMLDDKASMRAWELLAEGKLLEDAVIAADGLGEEAVLRFLAETFELPYVDAEALEKNPPKKEFLAGFPARVLLRHRLLPLEERDGLTIVATSQLSAAPSARRLQPASGQSSTRSVTTAAAVTMTDDHPGRRNQSAADTPAASTTTTHDHAR